MSQINGIFLIFFHINLSTQFVNDPYFNSRNTIIPYTSYQSENISNFALKTRKPISPNRPFCWLGPAKCKLLCLVSLILIVIDISRAVKWPHQEGNWFSWRIKMHTDFKLQFSLKYDFHEKKILAPMKLSLKVM